VNVLAMHHPLLPAAKMPFRRDPALSASFRSVYVRAQMRDVAPSASRNPYALQPDTLGFLAELLDDLSPRHVLEFGSGESTLLFAAWASVHGASVLSVENDASWIRHVRGSISPEAATCLTLAHSPLKPVLRSGRSFLTYRGLDTFAPHLQAATLILLDGPQASGREAVLYKVLNDACVAATIVIDDFNLYFVRDMLYHVPSDLAAGYVGTAIEDNSHGLYILRRVQPRPRVDIPSGSLLDIMRSFWRTARDLARY
jgi:hypothetical protein